MAKYIYTITEVEHLVKTYEVEADSEQEAREIWEGGDMPDPKTNDCTLCEIDSVRKEYAA